MFFNNILTTFEIISNIDLSIDINIGLIKLKNFDFDSYLALVENAKKSEVSRKKVKAFSKNMHQKEDSL